MRYSLTTTREQRVALKRVFDRTPLKMVSIATKVPCGDNRVHIVDRETTGSCDANDPERLSYRAFRKRYCHGPYRKSDPYLSVDWLGMALGIEPNGYTHS